MKLKREQRDLYIDFIQRKVVKLLLKRGGTSISRICCIPVDRQKFTPMGNDTNHSNEKVMRQGL